MSLSKAGSATVSEKRFDPNVGSGKNPAGSKKRDKKGFKADRYTKYKAQFDKNVRRKMKDEEAQAGKPTKEIKFDPAAREEWLTTRHKEKNARRVTARMESMKKEKRENSKFKREQREEARQQYNSYARVPILPDFSYKVPKYVDNLGRPITNPAEGPNGPDWNGVNVAGGDDEEDEEEEEDAEPHVLDPSSFYEDQDAKMGEGVRVDVRPLIAPRKEIMRLPVSNIGGKKKGPRGGGLDFSDLPPTVAAELEQLQKDQEKGAAQPQKKIHMLKEMAKIQYIKKTQRKGHGKKSKSGKKSHR